MKYKWRPTTNLFCIQQRAELLNVIRDFFKNRAVLEVETPLLCQYAPTMPYIDPIMVDCNQTTKRFLQTSPEYAMKRLLAAGIGDIFQVCKSFRGQEEGVLHNPEFTMLEWYRLNFDHHQLMQEIVDLLKICGVNFEVCKISYRDIFIKHIEIDPVLAELSDLKNFIYNNMSLSEQLKIFIQDATKRDCQELLFNHVVEPQLKNNFIWLVYNYPTEQAALAKISKDQDNIEVADRFEVYINGIELANGYYELLDPILQYNRFSDDQKRRQQLGKPHLEIDPYFMAALESGIPNCSGVALGVDRLLMLKMQGSSIKEAISFPWDIA